MPSGGGFLLPALRPITVDSVGVGTVPQIPIGVGPLVYVIPWPKDKTARARFNHACRHPTASAAGVIGFARYLPLLSMECGSGLTRAAWPVAVRSIRLIAPSRIFGIVRRCRSFRWGRHDNLRLDERGRSSALI